MAKKKKTREKKIIADTNRQKQLSAQYKYTFSPKLTVSKDIDNSVITSKASITTKPSGFSLSNYLLYDLKKTTILTAIIIGIQIFLKILLNNR